MEQAGRTRRPFRGRKVCPAHLRQQTDQGVWRRYVTLDAKTGGLERRIQLHALAGGLPGSGLRREARKKAEAFLSKYQGELFGKSAAYEQVPARRPKLLDDARPRLVAFVYAQQVSGYFFPDNCLYARIDSSDGSVSGFTGLD